MDTSSTVTLHFEKSSIDQELEQINFDTFDQSSAPKRNKFVMFFRNMGNKFKCRPLRKDKNVDLDPIQSGSKFIFRESFFGKLKKAIRPQQSIYKAADEEEDDSHGLVV
jgi:hypothetical protein